MKTAPKKKNSAKRHPERKKRAFANKSALLLIADYMIECQGLHGHRYRAWQKSGALEEKKQELADTLEKVIERNGNQTDHR